MILIIEPNVDGHYGDYLYKITDFFLQKGLKVCIAIDSGDEAKFFLDNKLSNLDRFERVEIYRFPMLDRRKKYNAINNLISQINFWKIYKKIYKKISYKIEIDYVFIPYIDRVIYSFSIFGSPFEMTPLSCITMGLTFHHFAVWCSLNNFNLLNLETYKFFAFKKILKLVSIDYIYTIDITLEKYSNQQQSKYWKKIKYFPDPVENFSLIDATLARKYFGIQNNDLTLLIYGSMGIRKNISGAVRWIIKMKKKSLKINLLIVGRQSDEVKSLLNKLSLRNESQGAVQIFILDKFASTEEEIFAFSASNLVWLNYTNFFQMSGLMIRSGILDLPMFLPDKGLMGWYKLQLLKSDVFPDFSIPRLRNNKSTNPFLCHTWPDSLNKLEVIVSNIAKNSLLKNS